MILHPIHILVCKFCIKRDDRNNRTKTFFEMKRTYFSSNLLIFLITGLEDSDYEDEFDDFYGDFEEEGILY